MFDGGILNVYYDTNVRGHRFSHVLADEAHSASEPER
jgi:hypothetical protein